MPGSRSLGVTGWCGRRAVQRQECSTVTGSTEASLYVEDTIRAGWNLRGEGRGGPGRWGGEGGWSGYHWAGCRRRGEPTMRVQAVGTCTGSGGEGTRGKREWAGGSAGGGGVTTTGSSSSQQGRETQETQGKTGGPRPAHPGVRGPPAPPLLGLYQWQRSLSLGLSKRGPLFQLADLSFVIDVVQEDRWVLTHTAKGVHWVHPGNRLASYPWQRPRIQGREKKKEGRKQCSDPRYRAATLTPSTAACSSFHHCAMPRPPLLLLCPGLDSQRPTHHFFDVHAGLPSCGASPTTASPTGAPRPTDFAVPPTGTRR